jgi:hypothetical protein
LSFIFVVANSIYLKFTYLILFISHRYANIHIKISTFRLIRGTVEENPERLNGIGWMANFLVALQVNNNFEEIIRILREEQFGCDSLVESLMKILDLESNGDIPSGLHTLQLEIALYVDAAKHNADF